MINLERVPCNICNSLDVRILKKIIIENKKTAAVCKCLSCNLVFLSPRPKNVEELYTDKYWELNEKKRMGFLK